MGELGIVNAVNSRTVRLLVTVKAYPVLSDRHGESVCVAGIEQTSEGNRWIRLFPVPFRKLPEDRKFKKYDIIELSASRTTADQRPESWLPNAETIRIVGHAPSTKGWSERKAWLHGLRLN